MLRGCCGVSWDVRSSIFAVVLMPYNAL